MNRELKVECACCKKAVVFGDWCETHFYIVDMPPIVRKLHIRRAQAKNAAIEKERTRRALEKNEKQEQAREHNERVAARKRQIQQEIGDVSPKKRKIGPTAGSIGVLLPLSQEIKDAMAQRRRQGVRDDGLVVGLILDLYNEYDEGEAYSVLVDNMLDRKDFDLELDTLFFSAIVSGVLRRPEFDSNDSERLFKLMKEEFEKDSEDDDNAKKPQDDDAGKKAATSASSSASSSTSPAKHAPEPPKKLISRATGQPVSSADAMQQDSGK
jgi:hypothetical protein